MAYAKTMFIYVPGMCCDVRANRLHANNDGDWTVSIRLIHGRSVYTSHFDGL